MKYFRMSYEEVVFKRSYVNLILLNRAIPGIKPFDKDDDNSTQRLSSKKKKKSKRQHANDFFQSLM